MNRLLVSSLALAIAATTAVGFAADDVKSGLQLGEHAGFFLVKDVTAKNKDKDMKSFVVLLTNDPDADEPKLEALAKKHNIKAVPLTMFDGVAGPAKYKISKDAETTVLLWKGLSVKANHAFAKGKFKKESTVAVLKDLDKILK